jgi:hypothetical protein
MTAFRYRLALVAACFQLFLAGTPMFAQTLQPSKTGLPGRTVWSLATTASGSGAARQTFTFAATDKGLWRSSDNGSVWTETTLKNQAVYAVKARTVGGTSTMLVGTDKGVLRSVDGGATWQSPEVTTGTVISTSNILQLKKVFDIEIVNSTWYAATDKGVFRSTTDGRTWTLLNIDRTVDNNEVRGITAEGSTIIVNLWKEGLWRSTNNGGSWAKVNITGETALCRLVYAHQGTSGTVWLAGAVSGNLWRSVNGGTAWTRVTTGTTTARSSAQTGITLAGVDAMTSLGKTLFAATATGMVVSQNDGQTWRRYPAASTKAISMASNGFDIIYVGYENEQKSVVAGKEFGAEVQAAGDGFVSFQIPVISKINYSQSPVSSGQNVDVEILGSNFLVPSPYYMGDKFEIINVISPSPLIWENQFLLRLGNVPQILSLSSSRIVIRFLVTNFPNVAYSNPYARVSIYYLAPNPSQNPDIQPLFVGSDPYFGSSAADYWVPVSRSSFPPTLVSSTIAPLFRTGATQNITLTGTNFISGTTKVFYSLNGGTRTEITPVTVNSATSIGVTVPLAALSATGTLAFTVENVAGSPSAALNVLVHNPLPTIQSVAPTSYARNSYLPITITGTGFVPETQVRLDNQSGWFIPTYLSPTQVRFFALGRYDINGLYASATSFQLLVQNPPSPNGQGGGASANLTIPIVNPQPSLSYINPVQIFTGRSATIALFLNASLLLPSSVVNFNNKTYSIGPAGFAATAFIIPPEDLTTTGNYLVTITTPAPGGGTSPQQVYLNVVNPPPTATSLTPTTVNAGVTTTITIAGADILPSSLVYMENVPDALATTVVNATTIRAVVPGTRIPSNGTYRFNIFNPTPLGGSSGFVSLTVNTPLANLTSVSPATLTSSAGAATLTLTGSLFEATAVAWISGAGITTQALTTSFGTANSLTATLPAALAGRAGTYTVTVRNPNAPDSQGQTLTVQNPRPRLTSLSAYTSLVGLTSLTLTATGSNFVENIQAFANGVSCTTTRTNAGNLTGSLTLTIPAQVLAQAGLVRIALQNPAPRQTPDFSDSLTVTVENPIARLDSLAPVPLTVSTQATAVTLYGTNFITLSVASEVSAMPATVIPTTWLSQTQLSASIPASLTATTGLRTFTVVNPLTTVPMPARVNVNVVNPTPFAQRITPSVITQNLDTSAANDRTLIITGDRFVTGVEVLLNNQLLTLTETTPTRLTVKIPAGRIAARGNYTVVVRNPVTNGTNGIPDGGAAQTLTLTVNTPQAVVSGITLSGSASGQVPLDTLNVPLVITGSQFLDSLTVRLIPPTGGAGVVLPLTSFSLNELRATIPFALLSTGGVYSLVVANPTPTNAPSLAQTFAVVNPVPELDSITTLLGRALTGSTTPQSIRLFGRRFTPTSVARWRDTVLTTTFVSRYEVVAELSPQQQTRGNVGAVSVFTPTDGVVLNGNPVGGGTGFAPAPLGTLFVTHAVPTLSALGSSTVVRDAWNPAALSPLSMTGLLITSTSTVRIQAVDTLSAVNVVLTPTSRTPNSLTVSVPRSVLQTTGVFRVSITNPPAFAQALSTPDGGTSGVLTFTVVNPPPSMGSLTPNALAVATVGVTPLAITGTNFTPESILLVNGRTWTRTVVSASSLTASLPDSLFTLSGFVTVRVVNPAPVLANTALVGRGDSSNVLTIEIFNPVPTLTTIAPVFAPITGRTPSDSVTVTLIGTKFVKNSLVRIVSTVAGAPLFDLPTVYRFQDTLRARMLAAAFSAGTYNITVVNPTPRGGVSAAKRFTVTNPLPILNALLPGTTTATGKAWTLTLIGQFFTPTSQVSYRNALQSLTNTSFTADTLTADGVQDTLRVKLAAVPVGDTTFPVVVVNPPTGGYGNPLGGGASDTMRLAVGLPVPQITTISPLSAAVSLSVQGRGITLTVNGSGFDTDAKIFLNGTLVPTTVVSTTRLTSVLPDSLQRTQGVRAVQVKNSPVLASNIVNATWSNPAPVLTSITPATVIAGHDTTMILTGDKFAFNATVTLTSGATITPLLVLARDSVLGLTVRIPDTLITRRQLYYLRVQNPPLVVDTVNVGGGLSAVQTLTVDADRTHSVTYMGLDTLLNTGDRMPFLTLRFRDRVGNLVDNPTTLYFASSDNAVTGTFPLTQTSLGNYRADTLRFPTAGDYRLWIDTTSTGALQVIGKHTFTVLTRSAARAEITGLPTTITAGDTIPTLGQSLTVRYFDSQNNLTDAGVRPVIVTKTSYRDTLVMTRLQTGVYEAAERIGYTTTGSFTLNLTGVAVATITGDRIFTVNPAPVRSVEYIGVDTLLNAGDRTPFVTLRFRDRVGNLTDHPAGLPSVSFAAASDTSLPVGMRPTPAQGSFPITQTGVGTYRADTLRFYQSGAFRIVLDTSVTGGLLRTGADFFRVMPLADSITTFEGLSGASSGIRAGDTIPAFTAKLVDKYGNFTDYSTAKWSFLRTTGLPAGGHSFASSATMRVQRLGTGFYRIEATTATVAGLYTFTLTGVPTTLGERTAQVVPLVASEVNISNVTEILSAGAKQSPVQLILSDRFGNRTDNLLPEQRQLWFSNSTDATILPNEAFTQAQAITQRVITSGIHMGTPVVGVYDVPATVALPFAGKYSFAVPGVSTTTGTTAFEVVPAADFFATFVGVQDTITAGEELPAFTVSYRDKQGNPTDNGVGRITYIRSGGSSTATIGMTRLGEGEYRVNSTVATLAGTYTLGVQGLSAVNLVGNRTFAIRPAHLFDVEFTKVTSSVRTQDGSIVTVQATYTDRFGNLSDFNGGSVQYSNPEFASTGTIQLVKVSNGKYSGSAFVKSPGAYLMEYQCQGLFDCIDYRVRKLYDISLFPGNAVRADFANVPTALSAGTPLSENRQSTITLRDWRGNKTHLWRGEVIFKGTTQGSIVITGNTLTVTTVTIQTLNEYGVLTIQPTPFLKRGTYTMSLAPELGSTINTIIATTGNRTIIITPTMATAVNIQIQNTSASIAGNAVVVRLRYTDRFENPTEYDDGLLTVTSTTGTLLTTTQTLGSLNSFPVYTSTLRVNTAGTVSLGVRDAMGTTFATLTGTTAMLVVPAAAQTAAFVNVPATLPRGGTFSFTLAYRDRFDNLTSNNVTEANVRARIGAGAWLYTVPMITSANIGIAQTTTPSFRVNTAGTYTIQALNDAGTLLTSTTVTVIIPAPAITVSTQNIDFGAISLTNTSTQTVIVSYQNITSQILVSPPQNIEIKVGNGAFSNQSQMITPTSENGTLTLSLRYIAITTGTISGMLNISASSQQTSTQATAQIRGKVIPLLTTIPPTITVENVPIPGSKLVTVIIRNKGLTLPIFIEPALGIVLSFDRSRWSTSALVVAPNSDTDINFYALVIGSTQFCNSTVLTVKSGDIFSQCAINVSCTTPSVCLSSTALPSDPYFTSSFDFLFTGQQLPTQWHLCYPANPTVSIQAVKAWEIYPGSQNNIITICDTGVRPDHPEFEGKVLRSETLLDQGGIPQYYYDNHGTFVAGMAAAKADGHGTVGVDRNARLISLYTEGNRAIANLYFSSDPDPFARISNHSYDVPNELDRQTGNFISGYFKKPAKDFANAYMNNKIACIASGNDGPGASHSYPARFRTSLVVGETDRMGQRAGASQIGPHIDVVAPGEWTFSTIGDRNLVARGLAEPSLLYTPSDYLLYAYGSGTSYASPVVAGVASLIIGYAREGSEKSISPPNMIGLYNDDVESVIKLSADKLPFESFTNPQPYNKNNALQDDRNDYVGHGKVNAYRALWYVKKGKFFHEDRAVNVNDATYQDIALSPVQIEFKEVFVYPERTITSPKTLVRPHEIRQRISYSAVGINRAKVWGRGVLMGESGYSWYDTASTQIGIMPVVGKYHQGIGWCDPIVDPAQTDIVTNTSALLQTYVYEVLNSAGQPTGQWIPCPPASVRFYYTVFDVPNDPPDIEGKRTFATTLSSSNSGQRYQLPQSNKTQQNVFDMLSKDIIQVLPNSPNPFNDVTWFTFRLKESCSVGIEVFDMLGIKVVDMNLSHYGIGEYSTSLSASTLPTGRYSVRFTVIADSGISSVKTMLVSVIK